MKGTAAFCFGGLEMLKGIAKSFLEGRKFEEHSEGTLGRSRGKDII